MISREEEILAGRIIPTVQELRLNSENLYRLANNSALEVKSPVSTEICTSIIHECSERFWNLKLNITSSELPNQMPSESYKITITQANILIEAADANAIRYAMNTLRQLAETERGVAKFNCYILPAVTISDAPRLAFRGLHICHIPETPFWELEKEIRLAAYYKFNYVVMEFWGTLRFKSHPELCWSEYGIEQSQVKALLKVAKSLGVTLIPQINLFGHASFSRCGSGKHALLDFHPEYASLFEPDGWSWCLSNPATRQYLTDLVLEIHELFDSPEY
ncbi:MAG: glycoside hydrolase family 20 zincin-like fold domain-containing protein, partial [Victivallaceae bacterium]